MGFFSKTLGRRGKQDLAPPPAQDSGPGAGRQGAAPAGHPGPHYGGPAASTHSTYIPTHSSAATNNNDDNMDDDDAASYHSITSSPGNMRAARTLPRDGAFAQPPSQAAPYATLPSHSRGPARPPAGSHFGSPGSGYSPAASGHAFSPAVSGHALSPAPSGHAFPPMPARGTGDSPARRGGAASEKPASAQELGEEYFQKAVGFHEEGDLVSATGYFKRAADKQNPLGMLFYGLSLRHGWGCQANEHLAFVFLQRAGETVVPHVKDMDPTVAGMAREELAMAIFELGQSYRQGWGVSRNKKTAAYYFEVAADLGDADAQADVAACYEKGDGVKRNMKRAAHYYRLAHRQGVELFGTSWIFKKKYDSD
ncbi:hypothetical protein H4R19_002279 [Coemansia spiralis]|nr:hypothetical protein H4R19_002279 [Coemansia spiralis]